MKVTKTTMELSMKSLATRFYIGMVSIGEGKMVQVNSLKEAIDNGTLLAMIEDCAKQLHNGEIKPVLDAMLKNLSSYLCETNDMSKYFPDRNLRTVRYDLIQGYVKGLAIDASAASSNKPVAKSYWQWSMEDIKSVDINAEGAERLLKSIYDNLASAKTKYPALTNDGTEFASFSVHYVVGQAEESWTFNAHAEKRALVTSMRNAIKNTTPVVSEAILAKLASGGVAKLTAIEAAELAVLLGKLKK